MAPMEQLIKKMFTTFGWVGPRILRFENDKETADSAFLVVIYDFQTLIYLDRQGRVKFGKFEVKTKQLRG